MNDAGVTARRLVAEAFGTALLLAAVVGSGIMAERLSGGNVAVALLANAIATGGALVALILTFGPISGAHFNPVVSLSDAWQGRMSWRDAFGYVVAQFLGAPLGVVLAHVMFGETLAPSRHARSGVAQWVGELVATFGLLAVIASGSRRKANTTPYAVAAYIVGAYWFTSSTSFANPAVTFARSLTNTFAGIRPVDVPAFVVAQMIGAFLATLLFRWLIPIDLSLPNPAKESVR